MEIKQTESGSMEWKNIGISERSLKIVLSNGNEFLLQEEKDGVLSLTKGSPYSELLIHPVVSNVIKII